MRSPTGPSGHDVCRSKEFTHEQILLSKTTTALKASKIFNMKNLHRPEYFSLGWATSCLCQLLLIKVVLKYDCVSVDEGGCECSHLLHLGGDWC